MSEDQICRTLSTKGQWVDYRPALHHSLFKADSTFDVRFAAILQCNTIVDRTLRAVFESYHKSLFAKLCHDITSKDQSVIDISFVSTAFSDGDRDYFIDHMIPKLQQETSCHVVDPVCDGCESAHDLLVNIADCLNCKLIDRASLLRNKGNTPAYIQSTESIRDTPIRAIASILSQRNANNSVRTKSQEQDIPQLVIVFRHCEMISTHILNSLLVLLSGPKVGFSVSIVAFTDVLCTLPVQFSASAQAVIRASLHTTVPPFELYDALCVSLFNGQEIPVVLSSWLIQNIHSSFAESELCLTSAVNRFKVCIAQHFEGRLSILSMYRETAWLQKMNILSRSESQFAPSAEKLKRTHSSGSVNNSSTYSHTNQSGKNSVGNNEVGSKRSSTRSAGKSSKQNNASTDPDEHTVQTSNTTENTAENSMEDADDSTIATLNTLGNNTLTTFNSTIYTTSTLAFPPVSADYGDVTLSQKAKQASVTRLKHQHGLVALLNLLKQSDLAPTGLLHKTESSYLQSTITEEKRVILEVFEVYEVRRKVDTVWFTLLKMLRDQLLPRQDDSRRYCADLLWADTLCPGTSADAASSTIHSGQSLDTARLSTSLLYAVQQSLSTISCAFVQAAVSNIREMADTHRKEITALMEAIQRTAVRNATATATDTHGESNNNNSVDYSTYNTFLQALEDGAKDIEVTFEGVAEYLETTNIGLHLSLKKMKEKVQNDKLSALAATPPNTTAHNNLSENNNNNSVPDLTYSKESHSVTSNSVNFYEEACVDLTNWLITIALQYATLPSAAELVSQRLASLPLYRPTKSVKGSTKSSSIVGKVNMDGVLYLHPQAEDRAVQTIDSNLHARFASVLKAPSDHLPPSTSTSTSIANKGSASFAPDTSVLYSMIKSCRQKEVASVWFEKFVHTVSPYNGISNSTSAAGKEHARRGVKRRFKTLDEKTVLKCRFANALYDIEKSGIVKCSRTSAQNPTVTIERKIYTWATLTLSCVETAGHHAATETRREDQKKLILMISIKYSRIPSYLHDSSFFKSLSDEEQEGEIQIPERCFAENDEVRNEQEFSQLLQVIAFWGLSRIPMNMITFCASSTTAWATQISDDHTQFQFAQDLLFIFTTQLDSPAMNSTTSSGLVRAVQRERTEIVEFLVLTPATGTQAASAAAELGRLDFLQLLHEKGHGWDENTCTLATKGGHLDCLRYLHEHGCPWDVHSLQLAAARYNQIACLKYSIEQGAFWKNLVENIALYGNLAMLQYAAENELPFTTLASYYAAESGHADCLRYILFDMQGPLDPHALYEACRRGHLACVKILHEYGVAWKEELCEVAADKGHLACLKYLHENGCPWDEHTSTIAVYRGDIEILRYAISHGCPYNTRIVEFSASNVLGRGMECFKYLVEDAKIPITNVSAMLNQAFARGNHFIFQYLFERDPSCQNQEINWPAMSRWRLEDMSGTSCRVLDANILLCIQCALQHNWNIDTCGHEMVQLLADKRLTFPLSFACVQPWFDRGLGCKKRKLMAAETV